MERIGMVDEAFLLARINKIGKGGGSGDGPSRAEFDALVERVAADEEAITEAAESAAQASETANGAAESAAEAGEAAQNALDTANGNVFIAEYGVTSAAEIMDYIDSQEPFAPILVKRGSDYYTTLLASRKNEESVYLRCVGSASGKLYIYTYTVTGTTWAAADYGIQEILVSGETIKTVNNENLLGAGNIDIPAGGGPAVFVASVEGTTAAEILEAIEAGKVIGVMDPGNFEGVAIEAAHIELFNSVNIQCIVGNIIYQYSVTDDIWDVYSYDAGKCMVKHETSTNALTLTAVSNATIPTGAGTGRFDYTLPQDMQAEWRIGGLIKWELFNGSDRLPAIPVFAFTMDNGIALRMGFKVCGSQPLECNKQSIAIILERR